MPSVVAPILLTILAFMLAVPARGADRFVSARAGNDSGTDCANALLPCSTIGHALTQVVSGEEVKVARGTYRENLLIANPMNVTISGAWRPDFSAQHPGKTRINGRSLDSVIVVAAGTSEVIQVTLDNVVITRGRANRGAGIRADSTEDGALTLALSNVSCSRTGPSSTPACWISPPAAASMPPPPMPVR
jgi:hypothetical protein